MSAAKAILPRHHKKDNLLKKGFPICILFAGGKPFLCIIIISAQLGKRNGYVLPYTKRIISCVITHIKLIK